MTHLIICYSTLQLAISKIIIQEENLTKNIDLLFLGSSSIKRNSYYLNSIKTITKNIFYYDLTKKLKNRKSVHLYQVAKDVNKQLQKKYNKVFIANYDDKFLTFLISRIHFSQLYTFDDGMGNIDPESSFNKLSAPSITKRILHKLSGRKYFPYDLMRMSECHYTIFEQHLNLLKEYKFISLIPRPENIISNNKTIKILLGTVYNELVEKNQHESEKTIVNQLKSFIKENKISIYIPHPREEVKYFSCETVVSEKISEEIIIDYISQGYSVELFGFASTVQFNLLSIAQVKNHILFSSYLSSRINEVYNVLCHDNFIKIKLI